MQELVTLMNDFHSIVNNSPAEDAPLIIMRRAANAGLPAAVEALARMLVIETARRRFAEARCLASGPAKAGIADE